MADGSSGTTAVTAMNSVIMGATRKEGYPLTAGYTQQKGQEGGNAGNGGSWHTRTHRDRRHASGCTWDKLDRRPV